MSDEEVLIEASGISKWYGSDIALNNFTGIFEPGVTALLGPNGSGKSTLMRVITGQTRPSAGSLRVFGHRPWNNPKVLRRVGFCPEQDNFYEKMTAMKFITFLARLSGKSRQAAKEAAAEALELVGMQKAANRRIKTYSKGMRQRTKIAQAIVHDPDLLLLDEPLQGTDPIVRHDLTELIKELGKEGKHVIVCSHIMHEVEQMTEQLVLITRGQAMAAGNVHRIRSLIDQHPHMVSIKTPQTRRLATRLIEFDEVRDIQIQDDEVLARVLDPDAFYNSVPHVLSQERIPITHLSSPDDNLEAVFRYLVEETEGKS